MMTLILLAIAIMVTASLSYLIFTQSNSGSYTITGRESQILLSVKEALNENQEIDFKLLSSIAKIDKRVAKNTLHALELQGLLQSDIPAHFKKKKYSVTDEGRKLLGIQLSRQKIADHEVIQAAIQNNGILTPSSLAFITEVDVDHALEKLEELNLKGVFYVENDLDGQMIYVLSDKSLLHGRSL